jgi:uncharacterized protein YcbK (DUF882 family)
MSRHRHRSVAWKRAHPWTRRARRSPTLRHQLDKAGHITPHFSWQEMADTRGVPVPRKLRRNAIRHCWQLERFRHQLDLAARRHRRTFSGITIDGPYRTPEHNREIGGARFSQHMLACATDHFQAQVHRWCRETGLSQAQIVTLAERIFRGVGNETSGTLHLDSRSGPVARFVTWIGAR